nr:MAG TPA: hypothetical protein [Caudoviricetes sp.]
MISKDGIKTDIERLIAKLKSSTTYSVEDAEKLKNALIVRDYLDKKEINGNFIIVGNEGNEKAILSSMTIDYRDNSLHNIANRLCSNPFNVIFLTNNKLYLANYLVYTIPWYESKGGKTLQTGVQLLFSNSINPSVCFSKVLYYLDLIEYSSIIDVLDECIQRIKFD